MTNVPSVQVSSSAPYYTPASSGTIATGQRLAAATTDAWSTGVTGDTGDRFVIDADGKHWWDAGDGGTADTNLYRSAADTLKTDDTFQALVAQTETLRALGSNGIIFKNEGGATLMTWANSGVLTIGDGNHIAVGTGTGTKFGTATTQKIGFFNKTPIVQPSGVADPSGGATVDAEARAAVAAVIANLEALGLQATVP